MRHGCTGASTLLYCTPLQGREGFVTQLLGSRPMEVGLWKVQWYHVHFIHGK